MQAEWNAESTDREYVAVVGLRIRIARLNRGWTGERLAEAAGISTRALQLIEHGKGNPTVLTLINLARALQQDLRDFLPPS